MFTAAHIVIFSEDAEADRAALAGLIEGTPVDAGGGWLIFPLPPAEAAVHPGGGTGHRLYLTCADIEATVAALEARGIACTPVSDEGWGLLTTATLPGGASLGVYQPRHPMAV